MDRFNQILEKHFKITNATDEMSSHDIPEWDSMNYLLFIGDLEKSFNVRLSMDEVLGAKNIGDVKNSLKNKGVII